MNKSLTTLRIIIFSFFVFPFSQANAQIDVTSPLERAVFQRELGGSADVTISGNYNIPVDKIEVRVTAVTAGQGTDIPWITLQERPSGGLFSGSIKISGGWYKIEVRASKSGIQVGNIDAISKVGVGEVFVISGQSNAQGEDETDRSLPLPPPAKDDRVNYIVYDNDALNNWQEAPVANIQPLQLQTAWTNQNQNPNIMGPRGHTAWCWGILGDYLVQRLKVPVLFVNTAWSGTSIRNWQESSRGIVTTSPYSATYQLPYQMPYANLKLAMQYYVKPFGARAILWMQGEADNYPLNTGSTAYKEDLKSVISKLASDINQNTTWVIARASKAGNGAGVSVSNANVIAGQNAVLNELPGITYPGPETDNLPAERRDGTHFLGAAALNVLANAWNNVLTDDFFAKVNPVFPSQEPKISSVCADNNASLNLSLPEGYVSYAWTIELNGNIRSAGGRSISVNEPGRYMATLKDVFGNAIRTQTMIINSSVKPAKPTIREIGSQQACADSSFTFSINAGSELYNWYKQGEAKSLLTGTDFVASDGGNYFVRSENVFGCLSDNSDISSLVIRPKIPTPVIERIGPFTAEAIIGQSDLNEKYEWKRGQEILLTSSINTLRTTQSGRYSAAANVTYVLENNILTCYSPYSEDLEVVTDGASDIVVFPNPGARDDIYLESREDISDAEITVFDLYGRVMLTIRKDMKSQIKIPVGNLASGKYVVRIKGENVSVSRQFVVL
ncbi:T9SS type A sorting domain-containing protein [Dyadobacter sp. CY345]|uniref:sialate O-acetylesterase n=1 Tax=Dyadobacter sp. CY345 TaxID=2909335 RepID=UPI001F393F21|nr:sialate O-acetylesterase [Dyadobacter sp. CY345]MCF2446961.1 T9SS type A sorting domain-containing protein [Dyadobacter sp. CY345]